jgi:hypothetical protein
MARPPTFPLRHFCSALAADAELLSRYCLTSLRVAKFRPAFNLLELDGVDLRRKPIETREATLVWLIRKVGPGLLKEHLAHPDRRHACTLGL